MKKLLYIVVLLLVSAICYGCRTTHYVPVESVQHDTAYINKVRIDSVYNEKLVYIKDDTVLIHTHTHEKIILRDTIYNSHTDSIQVPYPVERELSWWENIKMQAGGYAVVIAFAALVFFVAGLFLKLHKTL